MIDVAIITTRDDYVDHVELHCSDDCSFSRLSADPADRDALLMAIDGQEPQVAIVGPTLDGAELLSLVGELDRHRPHMSIVAVCSAGQNLIDAFRAGASEAIRTDAEPDDLLAVLHQAAIRAERRAGTGHGTEEHEPHHIVVLCPKGGAGKTTISTNLAVTMAEAAPGKVALVDLDLQFGDAGPVLRVSTGNTIADLGADGIVDVPNLRASLTPHESGLAVLASPTDLIAADISPQRVKTVIAPLTELFPYVVIDTAAGIDEVTLIAVEQATDLLFVTTTDVSSVRAVKRQMEAFDALGLSGPERHLVINRANSRLGMKIADIERALDLEAIAMVRSSTALAAAANQGACLREIAPRDKALRSLNELAHHFLPSSSQPRKWLG